MTTSRRSGVTGQADVDGAAVDAGHFVVEDQPAEVVDRLIEFLQ